MNTPKVIFAGTPDFAVAALRALVDVGITPAAVLTQPDRPAGRGKRLAQSPVKQFAVAQGLVVLQPPTLRDEAAVAELVALKPDILIVAAYGLILPQNVLDVPTAGCLNVHASLLPRWRGAAPIQAAILAGDDETGVCLMSMTAGLDCGPVYVSETVAIGEHETAGVEPKAQDESQATYASKTKPADAELDWKRTAAELERMIRAYDPVPGAWFMLDDARIKCRQAQQVADVEAPAGTIVAAGPEGIVISCGEGAIGINSLQKPGKRAVTAAEFATQFDLVGRRL